MTTPPTHPVPSDLPGNIDDGLHKQAEEGKARDVLVGGIKLTAVGVTDPGSIGCFLQDRKDPTAVYILTVMHLFGEGIQSTQVAVGAKVGHPDGRDGTCTNDVIGTFAAGDGAIPGIDEALIRLNPGVKWSPQIDGLGPITQPPADPNDPNPDHTNTAVVALDGTARVMKWGYRTGGTGGTVLADEAHNPDPKADHSFRGLFVVRPNDNGNEHHLAFAQKGDSGSVVVNAQRQVVGLVTGRNKFGNATALPIRLVLDRLNGPPNGKIRDLFVVTTDQDPAPTFTVRGAAMVPLPREIEARLAADPEMAATFRGEAGRAPVGRPWFTDVPPQAAAFGRLQEDLAGSAAGRILFALWERHRAELTGLLTSDRRLMLVWHRGGGAALVQLVLRMLTHPGQPLPETLHGEPLMSCLDRVYAELRRCASPALRADLAQARSVAPDLAGLDYQGILDALETAAAKEMTADA